MRGRLAQLYVRAPMVAIAAMLIVGIVAESRVPLGGWGYAAAVVGLLAAWAVMRWRGVSVALRIAMLLLLVAVVGAWRMALVRHAVAPDDLALIAGDCPQIVALRGRVADEPVLHDRDLADFPGAPERDPSSSFVVMAEQVRPGMAAWRSVCGDVRVICEGPALHLTPGDRVEVVGNLRSAPPSVNPAAVDRRRTAIDRRQFCVLWASSETAVVRIDATGTPLAGASVAPPPMGWRESLRLHAHRLLLGDSGSLTDEDCDLLDGLVLGRRSSGLREMAGPFIRTGTFHYLAVSGLHVGILAGFCWLVLRLLRVRPRRATLTVLLIVGVYCLMAEPRPPILRAGVMIGLLGAGTLLYREPNPVNFLGAAAFFLLLFDPGQLFDAGFQLSFVVVLGLLLNVGPVHRRLLRLVLRRAPDDPEAARPLAQDHPVTVHALRSAIGLLVVSAVAWTWGLPLVAWYFGRIHPLGILSSVVMWPVVWLVLMLGFAKMLFATLLPSAGSLLNGPIHAAVASLLSLVDRLDHLPVKAVSVPRPSLTLVIVFYTVLLLWTFRPRRVRPTIWIPAGLACIVAASLLSSVGRSGGLELTVLSVGDGAAQVLRLPDDQALLMDCGSIRWRDVGEQAVFPLLAAGQRQPGRLRVRAAFLSHPNIDHYSGLVAMGRRGVLGEWICSPAPAWDGHQALCLLDRLDEFGVPRRQAVAGQRFTFGDVTLDLLWPPAWMGDRPDARANDASQVVRVTWRDRRILFTGDLSLDSQERLLAGQTAGELDLRCDVLLMPHHGAIVPTTDAFVRAAAPSVVIVSTARNAQDILDRCPALCDPGRRVYFTSRDGAVTLRITEFGGMEVVPFITGSRGTEGRLPH
ncbi:MAG: ComE operon protein 3 [Phycisphaerae bacterium]|nr:ComE operon protein 3 [Phycisphaerae bacterium]